MHYIFHKYTHTYNCTILFLQVDDIVSETQNGLVVDISKIYGGTNSAVIQKMVNLESIDISFCCDIDASDFANGLIGCMKLKKVEMVGCKQFTEYHLVDICTSLPKLEYFDGRGCSGLQYCNANVILTNARNLAVFKVNMKYPDYEKKDWAKLKGRFLHVHFGEQIEKFLKEK